MPLVWLSGSPEMTSSRLFKTSVCYHREKHWEEIVPELGLTSLTICFSPQEASDLTLFLKENLFLKQGFATEPRLTLNLRSLGLSFISAGISRAYFYFLFTWVSNIFFWLPIETSLSSSQIIVICGYKPTINLLMFLVNVKTVGHWC